VSKDTFFQKKKNIVCRGKCISLSAPVVMGIVNLTPDSFYDGGSAGSIAEILKKAEKMLTEGAAILDLGAASSRPGAEEVSTELELTRLIPALDAIRKEFPDTLISIDTYRAKVAKEAHSGGADIINDISGGEADADMIPTVGKLSMPYILMHMQGLPSNMQKEPHYVNIIKELQYYFSSRIHAAHLAGISDIIIDPGFGFGKTVEHNYELLTHMDRFEISGCPILAGVSRKSMINKVLNTTPETALNGTTAANMLALSHGADILRVHDVKEARQAISIFLAGKS